MHTTAFMNHHQPQTQHGLWYNGQVVEERKKKQRAVLLVAAISLAAFVKRLLMLVLGLLRLSYRKVSEWLSARREDERHGSSGVLVSAILHCSNLARSLELYS